MVFAVTGEVLCDWNRKKSLKERLKKFFGMLLVAGLVLEIGEAIREDKHVASAENNARYAKIRAVLMESNNLILRSNVVALELKLRPRRISMEQRTNFITLAEFIPRIPIKILIGYEGRDTEDLANDLRETLTMAGFQTNADAGPWAINRDPTLIIHADAGYTNDPDLLVFSHSPDGDTNHILTTESIQMPNSRFRIPTDIGTNQIEVYGALLHCFNQLGITTEWQRAPRQVGTNECLIYVTVK